MSYRAPISDLLFAITHEVGPDLDGKGLYEDLADGLAETMLVEAAKFAENRLAPLNRIGDRQGPTLAEGQVTSPPGFAEAYRQWALGGWNAVTGPPNYGGMGLPQLLNTACIEIWNAANLSFSLCPLLTLGAIEALQAHGSETLKTLYLKKLVSGEWTGTMNLTEPQAGSDLGLLKTRAERESDGGYKLFGTKIFITYGEHDLADNIVHLVLARLPDAPPGTHGLSLFLVPKFLVEADGRLGPRNDVFCSGLEHKLGIHGSPTCTMIFGDHGGATAYLVGEEHKGLACMFTMMNNARLNVGVQGVAIAERATQQALAYAKERRQGHAVGGKPGETMVILRHPDVARMLMTMKALTAAARAICLMTAYAIDLSRRGKDAETRERAAARAFLLTPVAKAFATDIANEVTSLGVQVHGGAGYIEETGAAQLYRDARILAIYEGTNGIQAIDLVQRKLPLLRGEAVAREIADMQGVIAELVANESAPFGHTELSLVAAVESLARATEFLHNMAVLKPAAALAGATAYLRLFALARGGTALARGALAAARLGATRHNDQSSEAHIVTARFFAEHIASGASGLEFSILEGAGSVEAGLSWLCA